MGNQIMPVPGYNPDGNYCSYSPDIVFGVKINFPCFIHDRHYRDEIKTRKTRKQADISFRKMIRAEFKRHKKPVRGFFVAWFYYLGVRIGGRRAYI